MRQGGPSLVATPNPAAPPKCCRTGACAAFPAQTGHARRAGRQAHLGRHGQRLEGGREGVADVENEHGTQALSGQEQAAAVRAGGAGANRLHEWMGAQESRARGGCKRDGPTAHHCQALPLQLSALLASEQLVHSPLLPVPRLTTPSGSGPLLSLRLSLLSVVPSELNRAGSWAAEMVSSREPES